MKIIKNVTGDEVWNHWKAVENFQSDDFRSDIRNPLPSDTEWYLAMIEPADVQNLHIISSGDWKEISEGTFLVEKVVKNLDNNSTDENTIRISKDIKSKVDFLESGENLDTRLVLVSNNTENPFTIIEGNRRSVAFLLLGQLVGKEVYLGMSNSMNSYVWAKHSYEKI
ncbi:MAG: hypothetical protein Q7S74_03895 [Nanoarchaeota archaeon]|nr:hypothetical protein [Nanoarchaeota archaeon]